MTRIDLTPRDVDQYDEDAFDAAKDVWKDFTGDDSSGNEIVAGLRLFEDLRAVCDDHGIPDDERVDFVIDAMRASLVDAIAPWEEQLRENADDLL